MSASIRVLIAEDHLIARVGLATIVQSQPDMQVVAEASSGDEAVALHAEHHPDITLMDVRMPGLTGIEAMARIREASPQARFIAISTYSGDEEIRQALGAGAGAYLTKDVLDADLISTIRLVHAGRSYLPPAVAAVLAAHGSPPELTPRELDVLRLIVAGRSNREIAQALAIAEYTVKNHVKNILSKLNVADRTQAATSAIQRGIVQQG
jgi:two-component system NarL family response regulator